MNAQANPRILLGITGSIATTLAPRLASALASIGLVDVVATTHALAFFNASDVSARVWTDEDEWRADYHTERHPIVHIELRRQSDVYVIAPCTADTLSKLACGRADNLLTTVARAWDLTRPIVIAPAMNTLMWEHPSTREHLETLTRWYGEKLTIVQPIAKHLACGDEGVGALANIPDIVHATQLALIRWRAR